MPDCYRIRVRAQKASREARGRNVDARTGLGHIRATMVTTPPRGALLLSARGALAGAIGGATAGALEFLLARAQAAAFLPGRRVGLLLVFLVALYGALAALAGALAGALAAGLGWATDLGPMWRAGFDGEEPKPGARWVAYGVAIVMVGVALYFATQAIVLDALVRYHHKVLIAALSGAAVAGLAIPGAAAVFVIASALSPALRVGPRVRARLAISPTIAATAWTLGLVLAAALVMVHVRWLEDQFRQTRDNKAVNAARFAPIIVAAALALAHLAARLVGRRRAAVSTPTRATLGLGAALALPIVCACALYWPTLRQLDHRPFVALVAALVVALASALRGAGSGLALRARWLRLGYALALPSLLLAVALSVGRNDRVRKAATSFTGLAGPSVRAIQTAVDFDRDGYSPLLGGGDCNDFDAEVHPGAFDWPDDGIDQDCNGHQATLAARAPAPFAAVPPSVPESPNVLLITIDALRADHVGSYGYARATTPNLDALAAESVRFSNGWAHAPSTRYSVPAILIGRYPSTIAVNNDPRVHWPPQVLPENRLISEILHDLGYRTSAFLSYYYFEPGWGLSQGFDDYDYSLQRLHSIGGDPAATHGTSSRELADKDVEYINTHKDQKFFLWTHYYDTHFMFERHPDLPESNFGNSEIDLYDGEIRFTDFHIGRVFAALKAAGLWDKTIIIITSDHGDGFGEHGLPPSQRHGYHLYRNETKVPILIRVPGVAPRVVDEPVSHVDLLPTLLNALRRPADAEPTLLGSSAFGLMLGERAPEPRKVFQEVWYEGPTSRKAVVNAEWHLIRNLVPDDTVELYRLPDDPGEEHDRAGDGDAAERALSADLAAWMDEIALPADFARRVQGNLSHAPLPFEQKLGDDLDGLVAVEGVDVKTKTVKRGEPVELALILHGLATMPEGWHLFTHLVGANGRRLNADHEPLEGMFALARVRKGVWLRDRVRVTLPPDWPPGPLTVEVGLWQRGRRAPAHGAHSSSDAVRAATIPVQP
jgi:arylsulfatase A-like enzyme